MKRFHILFFSAILFTISCNNKDQITEPALPSINENEVSLSEAQIKNAGIESAPPQKGKMSNSLKLNGMVDVPPQNMVSISFPLGGYLQSTQLLEGTRVKKGQALAVMQDQSLIQLQQDYLMAVSKTYFLEKEFKRQQLLNANKSTSDKVFEQIESEYRLQKIMVSGLKEKLKLIGLNPDKITEQNITRFIPITSPIDGYVSKVNVNIGKFVNPSEVLFELVNPTDLHLSLRVFEKDIHDIEIGQRIHAYMANNPEKIFEAEVILISKNLDADRTAVIHCHFEQPEHELLPGMFLNAEVEIENQEAILVSEDAVVRFGAKEYIFSDKGNRQYEMIPVTTGNTSNGKTAISSETIDLLSLKIVQKNAYSLLMKLHNKEEE